MREASLGAAALLLTSASLSCDADANDQGRGGSCSPPPCTSVALDLRAPQSITALHAQGIEVCRNEGCLSRGIYVDTYSWGPNDPHLSCNLPPSDADNAYMECSATRDGTGTNIHVVYTPERGQLLADGDRFRVRITDASRSTTLVELTSTAAHYTVVTDLGGGDGCFTGAVCKPTN